MMTSSFVNRTRLFWGSKNMSLKEKQRHIMGSIEQMIRHPRHWILLGVIGLILSTGSENESRAGGNDSSAPDASIVGDSSIRDSLVPERSESEGSVPDSAQAEATVPEFSEVSPDDGKYLKGDLC